MDVLGVLKLSLKEVVLTVRVSLPSPALHIPSF